MKITAGHGDWPRYRYRPTHKVHWCAIETAIAPDGLEYDKRRALHRTIRDLINRYRGSHLLWRNSPRPGKVSTRLKEVVDAAGELNRILAALGPIGGLVEKEFSSLRSIYDMLIEVAEIESAAARAIIRLPHVEVQGADGKTIKRLKDAQGGPSPDIPCLHLVARLGGVFEDTTGQKATLAAWDNYIGEYRSSRFVEFLQPSLNLAGLARLKGVDMSTLNGWIRRSRQFGPSSMDKTPAS